jgi:multidrug efflux pump subunit AcrA (membrane-fusion protein)
MIKISALQQIARIITKPFCKFAVVRFPLPDLGEKIKEGRIKKLYVREGDRVG